ncbi:phosphoribosyl-AMP cyclohydrolase, partial [Streptomyces laculatispora]|nr:phosphoribosyl-AMP cyclohydrolase [Streptomyces laculatispora]
MTSTPTPGTPPPASGLDPAIAARLKRGADGLVPA